MNQTFQRPEEASAAQVEADLRALFQQMMEGETALARRRDIGELHRRLLSAIGPAAEEARPLLNRLDSVEKSINSMEGALRIELEPMLRAIIDEAVEKRIARPAFSAGRTLLAAGLFVAGLMAGMLFAPQIEGFSQVSDNSENTSASDQITTISPKGGSEASGNHVN